MEKEITKEKDGLKVTVKIERDVKDDIAYCDGDNVNLGKKAYEATSIKVEKNGKSAFCRDLDFFSIVDDRYNTIKKTMPQAYARLGDMYISKPIYDFICEVMDEVKADFDAETDTEFTTVKAIENKKEEENKKEADKIAKFESDRSKHPGWCNKCQSYCYGDCDAN